MDVAPSKRLPLLPTTASARFYCPRKCGKLNRTANVSIGGFQGGRARLYIARGTLFIFGEATSAAGDKIIQMVVDESRGWLLVPVYTVVGRLDLRAFDLSGSSSGSSSRGGTATTTTAAGDDFGTCAAAKDLAPTKMGMRTTLRNRALCVCAD